MVFGSCAWGAVLIDGVGFCRPFEFPFPDNLLEHFSPPRISAASSPLPIGRLGASLPRNLMLNE